jgi:hypothetical protein
MPFTIVVVTGLNEATTAAPPLPAATVREEYLVSSEVVTTARSCCSIRTFWDGVVVVVVDKFSVVDDGWSKIPPL